jgi:4-amino-4-deoxy-L-arabinose transferase-like glycosyltransferase
MADRPATEWLMEEAMPKPSMEWARRWAPEGVLAVLAAVVFLGCLGSVDLWGKREQRASAEAIDTVREGHWLVAEIQGRPRLEKPPLPRWTIATLIRLTGRSDEWIVRLPSALSALGMVALVYGLGRRIAGRAAGQAGALALTSFAFFISELRQAGNDGPLAFFTTLAIYSAWRRIHGGQTDGELLPPTERLGARGWSILMYAALGLGFLTKGPIVLILTSLAIIPYLAISRRLVAGVWALFDLAGILLFVILALSWPLPVLLRDPNAARVWYLEMGQKAGTAGITHHRQREMLAASWPWMTTPWSIIATYGAFMMLWKRGRGYTAAIALPWAWTILNLGMFCLWKVAKPNYFLPCLPGAAILTGIEWVNLTRAARSNLPGSVVARRLLQGNWVFLFVAAAAAPVVVGQVAPAYLGWAILLSALMAAGIVGSAFAWHRGADAFAMAPMVGALAVGSMIGYGIIAPADNAIHSHRELANTLDQLLPADTHTVMFFHEIDEGLWFYLHDRDLKPIPGSQPRYNDGMDLMDEYINGRIIYDPVERMKRERQILINWIRKGRCASPYVLIRTKLFDQYAPALESLATRIHSERGLKRNDLTLLRINPGGEVAAKTEPETRR